MIDDSLQRYWSACLTCRSTPPAKRRSMLDWLPRVANMERNKKAKARLQTLIMTERKRIEVA